MKPENIQLWPFRLLEYLSSTSLHAHSLFGLRQGSACKTVALPTHREELAGNEERRVELPQAHCGQLAAGGGCTLCGQSLPAAAQVLWWQCRGYRKDGGLMEKVDGEDRPFTSIPIVWLGFPGVMTLSRQWPFPGNGLSRFAGTWGGCHIGTVPRGARGGMSKRHKWLLSLWVSLL